MFAKDNRMYYDIGDVSQDPVMAKCLLPLISFQYHSAMGYLTGLDALPAKEWDALGCEALNIYELLCTLFRNMIENLSATELIDSGLEAHYIRHTGGVGVGIGAPFLSSGDPVTDIAGHIARAQYMRTLVDNVLRIAGDPPLIGALLFIKSKQLSEIESLDAALKTTKDSIRDICPYAYNPAFDLCELQL